MIKSHGESQEMDTRIRTKEQRSWDDHLSVIPAQTEETGNNSNHAAGDESCSTVNDINCK